MKQLLIIIAVIGIAMAAQSQNLVGYNVDEIRKIVKKVRPSYEVDETSLDGKNPSIKFMDKEGDNTLMYFIDENGICKYAKFMLDIDVAKNTVDTLTRKHKYVDKLTWIDKTGKKDCRIQMQNSDWFFTLLITEEK